MQIRAYAKINWTLSVTGKRPDGYHLLDMVMQKIDLYDTLDIELSDSKGIRLEVIGNPALSSEKGNIILKAAELLSDGKDLPGLNIRLTKAIPTGAGLGGGSADAAAVLKALNRLWNLNLSDERLAQIGLSAGADVPYCLNDFPARVQGIGEKIDPFRCRKLYPLVLLKPERSLCTADVFRNFDHFSGINLPDVSNTRRALETGDQGLLTTSIGNCLEYPALELLPSISECKEALRDSGAFCSMMTGSGSAVFGAFSSHLEADCAYRQLSLRFPICIRADTMQEVSKNDLF